MNHVETRAGSQYIFIVINNENMVLGSKGTFAIRIEKSITSLDEVVDHLQAHTLREPTVYDLSNVRNIHVPQVERRF